MKTTLITDHEVVPNIAVKVRDYSSIGYNYKRFSDCCGLKAGEFVSYSVRYWRLESKAHCLLGRASSSDQREQLSSLRMAAAGLAY